MFDSSGVPTGIFISTVTHIINPVLDWGDAPNPLYPTLSVNMGPNHQIVPAAPFLGPAGDTPDPDANGQPNPTATGDDTDGNDDEDGLISSSLIENDPTSFIQIHTNGGILNAWIDFNADGDFTDPGEHVITNAPAGAGPTPFAVTVPSGTAGDTFLRLRVSTVGTVTPIGPALDGEVEDHMVTITPGAGYERLFGDDTPYSVLANLILSY